MRVQFLAAASPVDVGLRGLHVVDDRTAWASGASGTWLRSPDGGQTWVTGTVAGARDVDFRDVHAFDHRTAVLMGTGSPARIVRTTDGGESWNVVYEDDHPAAFLDSIAFWDSERGVAFGDPTDGVFTVLLTSDGGVSWTRVPNDRLPAPLRGEAGFAASGTCIATGEAGNACIGLGGHDLGVARVLLTEDYGQSWRARSTTIVSGQSRGIFSVARGAAGVIHIVGGDYRAPELTASVCARSDDGGATWTPAAEPPAGFRSAVAEARLMQGDALVAVGTNGADVSADDGRTWRRVGEVGYHAIAFAPGSASGIAVGADGRIGRVVVRTE